MQINIEKNLVELTPENSEETAKLQALWRVLVDCARFNKKMVPVGEYIPDKNTFARFAIEGITTKGAIDYPEVHVDKACRCYCQTCNKYVLLKKGDRIPPCCGKLMEIMD
jgi:Zn finger protein HypA/HybF involved in hydrogenase expression